MIHTNSCDILEEFSIDLIFIHILIPYTNFAYLFSSKMILLWNGIS